MRHFRRSLATALVLVSSATASFAQGAGGTPEEAQERLKALVESIKSKGAEATAKSVMGADDPFKCRYKDLVCIVVDHATNSMLVHTAVPKLVGSQLDDDIVDVDGNSLTKLQFGPAKQGKLKWDAKYKFSRPDTKKIVPRWAFCEKADASRVVCTSVSY